MICPATDACGKGGCYCQLFKRKKDSKDPVPWDVAHEDAKGNTAEGSSVPESDSRRIFEYYPLLGKKFNDTLVLKDKIPSHNSQDRMIAARFEIPQSQLDGRRKLMVRIEDVDGPVSELLEKKK